MKKLLILFGIFVSQLSFSQNIFRAVVRDSETKEALTGATALLENSGNGASSDNDGKIVIKNIPNGSQTFEFSFLGYEKKEITLKFPLADSLKIKTIYLEPEAEEMQEVVVTSTRTNSRIEDVPMRIEVIGNEEVTEEENIKSANVSKLLLESPAVQAQQTSSVNGNISFRLEGLDGKYTQMLKDGFPVYGGFAQGLSVLQIPPLDLQQVEIIKGSSSLYGSDAIAGIINFVSKQPTEDREMTLLVNQTSQSGTDLNGYFSQRWGKFGMTFLTANNFQQAIDVNKDGFSDVPKSSTYSLSPDFFYYFDPKTTLNFGVDATIDHRKGGDMKVLNNQSDSLHRFFQDNISDRVSGHLKFEKQIEENSSFTFKNSVSWFKRALNEPTTAFSGQQLSSFTEAGYNFKTGDHQWVVGADFLTQKFTEDSTKSHLKRDYNYMTTGIFAQDDYKPTDKLVIEAGLRADYQNKFGFFFLPRLALKYQFSDQLYVRAGSGFGYKVPDIYSTASEQEGINNIQPLSANVQAERSIGGNLDINYKLPISDESSLTFNQSFFTTQISHPLVLDSLTFVSENKPIVSSGFESDLRYNLDEFQIFLAYTYVNAQRKYDINQPFVPLTPQHKLNLDIIYEVEDNFSVAFEGYYVSSMYRDGDTKTQPYCTIGLIAQKHFRHFTLIANAENLTDVRQSRFESIVLPPVQNPTFRQLYAPVDGRVFNVAIRYDF